MRGRSAVPRLPVPAVVSTRAPRVLDLNELLGVLAITGVGGVLWWEVFAVDDTALGGWLANGARLLTVVLAILLTIYKDHIWKPLPIEANGPDDAAESTQIPRRL